MLCSLACACRTLSSLLLLHFLNAAAINSGCFVCMPFRQSTQLSAGPSSPQAAATPRSTRANSGTHVASPSPLTGFENTKENTKLDHPARVSRSVASPRSVKAGPSLDGRTMCEALSTSDTKVMNLGRVFNHPAFHTSKFIFPVGFKSQYLRYPSVNDPSRKVAYTCWVEEMDQKPLFVVQCDESTMRFTGSSPTAAWEAVEANLNEMRRSSGRGNKREIDGMALFGLSNPLVVKAIAKLPGADEVLAHYAPKPPSTATCSIQSDSPKRSGAVVAAESVFSIFNKKTSVYKKPPALPKLSQGCFRWLEANFEAFEPPVCGNKVEFSSVEEILETLQSMWQAVAIVNFCRTFKAVIGLPFHMADLASAFFDASSSILLRHLHLRLLMPDTSKNDTRELCDRENAWLNMLHARLHLPRMESYSDAELLQYANMKPEFISGNGSSAKDETQAKSDAGNTDACSDESGPEVDDSVDVNQQEFVWSLAFDKDPFPGDPSSWFTLSLHIKVNILLLLCEEAVGTCDLFRTRTSMDEDAENARGMPICVDRDGSYYWYMADDSSAVIYKEVPPRFDKKDGTLASGSCQMSAVCNSVPEMTALATSWKRSKHNGEKLLSDHLLNEEIPRLEGIALSKERAERRQLELELMPRKRSSRIQEVTIKKTREEEEEERRREDERKRREEKEARRLAAEARAKEEERRLRAEAREAERIKEEADRKKMEQERAELRARRLMEREGLLRSDRLLVIKNSGSVSSSEVSTPHAGAGASLDFHDALVGGSVNSECAVAPESGVSAVKKAKISIPSSSVAQNDVATSSTPADIQRVIPTAADLLSVAIEIKRNNPGCGVKKVHLEMLHKHPDWSITEHRVGKLLHENGLANVKKSSCVTANSDSSSQSSLQQQHPTVSAAADIHFDILSLPQSDLASAELWQASPLNSSRNSGSPLQPAEIIDLDKLFNPAIFQRISDAVDASDTGNGSANADAKSTVDLDKVFTTSATPVSNAHQ